MLLEARKKPQTPDEALTMAIAARVETFIHFGLPPEPESTIRNLLGVAVHISRDVYLSPRRIQYAVTEILGRQAADRDRYWNAMVLEEGVPIGMHWAEAFNFDGRPRSVRIHSNPPEALVARLTNQDRVIK